MLNSVGVASAQPHGGMRDVQLRSNVIVGLAIAFMSALELWLIHCDPAPYDGCGPAVS
jgi:hypothetical protein